MVKNILRRLFSNRRSAALSPPDGPKARKLWLQTLEREWQLQWHDLFDADQTLIAAGEFARPDPVPEELDRDYRLIFGISRAEKATRAACFAPMPKGAEMAARFDAYLTSKPTPMSEDAARDGVARLARIIPDLDPQEEVNFDAITVIDRDTDAGKTALRRTGDILYVLEGTPVDPLSTPDAVAACAYQFLSEPLYASCGNFYHLRDWVTGPLFDPRWDDIQSILFPLWDGGWQVRIDDDGVVLAKRHVGPKSPGP